MPVLFLDPWNFDIIFFQYTPRHFMSSTPPSVWNFFWNSSIAIAILKLSHKIIIWLFGLNSLVRWAIPEKIQTGRVEVMLFWKRPLKFLDLFFRNSRENKLSLLEILKDCVTSLGNSKVKNQNPWKFHMSFFLKLVEIPPVF